MLFLPDIYINFFKILFVKDFFNTFQVGVLKKKLHICILL